MPVPMQRAKLQGSTKSNKQRQRDARLSMIPRIRLIITAVMLCHLFLHPGVLTSQLRAAESLQGQASTSTHSDVPSADPFSDDQDALDLSQAQNPATPPATASKPQQAGSGSGNHRPL